MGSFCENSKQLNAVNYFRNKVFLIRKIFLSHFPCVEKVCKITFVKQIPEAATEGFLKKGVLTNLANIHRKIPVPESLFK